MNILIVGGGGREHALAWKSAESELVECVFVAPGNAGTAAEPGVENIDIASDDLAGLLEFAKTKHIELTIIGPEAPLVDGVVDLFCDHGLKCFGPTSVASQLEGSKTFSKEFLTRHNIPTAKFQSFVEINAAIEFAASLTLPLVIKADGLAAGKGVVIAESDEQAESTIRSMLSENSFGEAGSRVVVEEFLLGEEASFICIVDGTDILPMATSQDHKAAYDGDTGPNTGGMGAYSPASVVDDEIYQTVLDQVIKPTVEGLKSEGIRYTGFLYAGLMIGDDGIPKVLEFNCRFGDPETQPVLLRMTSDLVKHCLAAVNGELSKEHATWHCEPALGVVMAADGYPGSYEKGDVISGLEDISNNSVKVFHAGTESRNGETVTSGGRVLCITALADDIGKAQKKSYDAAKNIQWRGCWQRNDIGYRAINRSR